MNKIESILHKKPSKWGGFRIGLLAGAVSTAWTIYLFVTKSVLERISSLSLLIVPLCLILGVYFAMRVLRAQHPQGLMPFRDALKAGLQAVVSYTLLMAFTNFVCQAIIYPEFSIDAIANAKAHGIAEHRPPAEISDVLNKMKEDIKMSAQITKTVAGSLFTGAICSLLMAGLMRRQAQ